MTTKLELHRLWHQAEILLAAEQVKNDRLRAEIEAKDAVIERLKLSLDKQGFDWCDRITALERELAEPGSVTSLVMDKQDDRIAALKRELAEAKTLITWNLHLHHGISRDSEWQGSPSDAEWGECLTQMHAAIGAAKEE